MPTSYGVALSRAMAVMVRADLAATPTALLPRGGLSHHRRFATQMLLSYCDRVR